MEGWDYGYFYLLVAATSTHFHWLLLSIAGINRCWCCNLFVGIGIGITNAAQVKVLAGLILV
jgi:hypothetical protein